MAVAARRFPTRLVVRLGVSLNPGINLRGDRLGRQVLPAFHENRGQHARASRPATGIIPDVSLGSCIGPFFLPCVGNSNLAKRREYAVSCDGAINALRV